MFAFSLLVCSFLGVNFLVKNRGSIDILADILKASAGGSSKTRIMFKANLSYGLLMKYLTLAISNGLISLDRSIYSITSTGKAFLEQYVKYCTKFSKIKELQTELDSELLYLETIYLKSNLLQQKKINRANPSMQLNYCF